MSYVEYTTPQISLVLDSNTVAEAVFEIIPPPPHITYAARVPMMPILALKALKKLRNRFIRKEVHEKVHPII